MQIGVVGLGRLGGCLARALRAAGLPLRAIASVRSQTARDLACELGEPTRAVALEALCEHAELVFLAVPDAHVAEVCEALACASQHSVVHTSGALDTSALSAARERGAQVGTFHPLQAFAANAPASAFHGIYVGIDAPAPLHDALRAIAVALGARTLALTGIDRARYHAAAVFVSNYVVALHAAAARIWCAAGLPAEQARAALAPLTLGAAEAIAQRQLASALTGPLSRGDGATLARHLDALREDPASQRLYRELAAELLGLPLALDPATRRALEQLLRD